VSAARERLAAVRGDPRHRYVAMVLGGTAGVVLASFHWTGLVVGGAAVGLAATRVRYALGAGALYGVLAWATFAAWLSTGGVLAPALDAGTVFYLSFVLAVVTATLGSLARGLI